MATTCDTIGCSKEGVKFIAQNYGVALWFCYSCALEHEKNKAIVMEPSGEYHFYPIVVLRPQVHEFSRQMERQLTHSDHKGGWQKTSVMELLHHLRHEVNELEEAVLKAGNYAICVRAADVANFAMFVADNTRHLELQSSEMCGVKHTFVSKQNSHLCRSCNHFQTSDCHIN